MRAADYHERTKHRLDGYAAGPGRLDWADQPEAFRDYGHCPRSPLPPANDPAAPDFADLADGRHRAARPLDIHSLGQWLHCSMAISAWKRYGTSRWALRCNPSSGNLHPTEAYLVLPETPDAPVRLEAGLYHYRPQDHQLEQRCAHPPAVSAELFRDQPAGAFLIGLSSIPWREAWKYGERAWRYCLLDQGHAVAALGYAAALLGWRITPLTHLADRDLAVLMGLDRQQDFIPEEPEYAEELCLVTPADNPPRTILDLPVDLVSALSALPWHGRANRLSTYHNARWPVIDEAIRGAEKPPTPPIDDGMPERPRPMPFPSGVRAIDLIHRRRSAQSFDGATSLTLDRFLAILDHALPRASLPPWDAQPSTGKVHLVLFVHRVQGLPKGLYLLPRNPDAIAPLRQALRDEFIWERAPGTPDPVPLYCLLPMDTGPIAARFACLQDIAADSAFSVAMLAEFERGLAAGSWGYRQLMREAGIIGQTLYLGAEACDMQGTGIGCFFDDALHELLGLRDRQFQVLYQFTLGKGLVDTRIATEPPYPDLGP